MFVDQTGVFLERELSLKRGENGNIEHSEVQAEQIDELKVEYTSQIVEENSTYLENTTTAIFTRECRVLEISHYYTMRHYSCRMTKGMPRIETTGPAKAEVLAGIQISAERLAVLLAYP
ncbi:hypothetical protein V6N11_013152 [Hibiscus sabdariffa]|uniref:Uncharacterized protein n=1 Tax=Hibiscus sabdariffa TaxID=183260 RepID=A0ABR2NF16_9ROSI